MKRILLTLMFAFLLGTAVAQKTDTLCLYLKDSSPTNVREKPANGKIIKTIPHTLTIGICVCEARNGWWRIAYSHVEDYDNDTEIALTDSAGEAWVHYSVLAFSTRNYGNQKITLRKSPDKKAAASWSFGKETELRPLDCKNGWIKVSTLDGKHVGWMEMEWVCGNPLTNCC